MLGCSQDCSPPHPRTPHLFLSDLISCATYLYASGFNFLIKTVAKKAKIEFFMVNINYILFDSTKMCACLHAVVFAQTLGVGGLIS